MLRGFASLGKWGRRIDANDANAALTVNQRGSGALLDLQAAGVSKFAVSNAGAISAVVGVTSTSDITTTTVFKFKDGGTNFMTFKKAADAAARNITFPDVDDTVVTLAATQELDNKTLDASVAKGVWTSSAWSIGAVTLAGAVAGGAQAITNLGSLLIGSATAYGIRSEKLEIHTAGTEGGIGIFNWKNIDSPSYLVIGKSRGDAVGNYGIITSGDTIFKLQFLGADGTNFQPAGYLEVLATGTMDTDRIPGRLLIHLYSDAASSVDTTLVDLKAAGITWNAAIPHTGLAIASAGQIEGLGTGANGFKLKNLKNAAATALSGTQLDVEIDIGGVPYYFTVYPTKAG